MTKETIILNNNDQEIAVDFDKFLDSLGPEYEEGRFARFDLQTFAEEQTEAQKALDECFDDDAEFIDEDFEELDLLKLLDQLKRVGAPAKIRFELKWKKNNEGEFVHSGFRTKRLILKENGDKEKTAEAIHTFLSHLKSYRQVLEYTMTINGKEETHSFQFPVEWFENYLWDELMDAIEEGFWQPQAAGYIFKQVSDTIKEASKTLENQDKEPGFTMEDFNNLGSDMSLEDFHKAYNGPYFDNNFKHILTGLKNLSEELKPAKVNLRIKIGELIGNYDLNYSLAAFLADNADCLLLTPEELDVEEDLKQTVKNTYDFLDSLENPAKLIEYKLTFRGEEETYICCLPEDLWEEPIGAISTDKWNFDVAYMLFDYFCQHSKEQKEKLKKKENAARAVQENTQEPKENPARALTGKWGIELAEGTFMNTISREQAKQFLAATTDNYRRAYDKFEAEFNTEKPQNTIKFSLKINDDEKVYEVSLPDGLCVSSKRIFEQVDESFARIMKDLTPTNTLQVASLIPLKRYLYDCYNKYWEQLEKERYYHDLACKELAQETIEDIEKFFEEYGVKL